MSNKNSKIDKIVAFCLMKGVQPCELITAIFEKEYTHIETIKNKNDVYLIISYNELVDNDIYNIKMRYTYDLDSRLQRIEQKTNKSGYKIQWDRIDKLKEIICTTLGYKITDNEINNLLIKLLPESKYNSIKLIMKLVA
ncbi:hypothetical protein [Morganella morganii]|uniref:hypothetical protein n=1 Tax=Morganella morganii TaxID=582 RepID=UPI0015E84FE6|nr:hypothetical protein [Morganella morganii]